MAPIHRIGELEIDEDVEYQEGEWARERLGWASIAILVLAGLLGVFGRGVAADAAAGKAGSPLHVEYQRFTRMQAPDTLVVSLGVGTDRVRLSREYFDAMKIEDVMPQPEAVHATQDFYLYVFRRDSKASNPIRVSFHLRPLTAGAVSGEVSLEEGPKYRFRQLIYP